MKLALSDASAGVVDGDRLITGARLEPVGMRERLRIARLRGWTAGRMRRPATPIGENSHFPELTVSGRDGRRDPSPRIDGFLISRDGGPERRGRAIRDRYRFSGTLRSSRLASQKRRAFTE